MPSLVLSIDGSPEPVGTALETMFQLCSRSNAAADVVLRGRGGTRSEIGELLPDWLRLGFANGLPTDRPGMVFGPDFDSGCALQVKHRHFYAWQSQVGSRIDLVCELIEGSEPPVIQPVLNPVLRDILTRRGETLLHAALVQSASGSGLLIIAPSGGGKTTTAIAVVRLGGRLVADDLVSLHTRDERVVGRGIPKVLNLRSGTLEFFSELGHHPAATMRTTGELRTNLSPSEVYGRGCLVDDLDVNVIYLPRLSSSGPKVTRIGAGDAMQSIIWAHAFSPTQRLLGESLATLASFLGSTPIYELETGTDPAQLGVWLNDRGSEHAAT